MAHQSDPLHNIQVRPLFFNLINSRSDKATSQKWTGEFFVGTTFFNLGATYQLGHHVGEGCSMPSLAVDLTLFDISGVTTVRVHYCYCGEPGKQLPPRVQLLRMRWFPATLRQPGTAFTFRLLDHVHKLQTRSKVNLYDVYATLIAIHNASGLDHPIVSTGPSQATCKVNSITVPLQ